MIVKTPRWRSWRVKGGGCDVLDSVAELWLKRTSDATILLVGVECTSAIAVEKILQAEWVDIPASGGSSSPLFGQPHLCILLTVRL